MTFDLRLALFLDVLLLGAASLLWVSGKSSVWGQVPWLENPAFLGLPAPGSTAQGSAWPLSECLLVIAAQMGAALGFTGTVVILCP